MCTLVRNISLPGGYKHLNEDCTYQPSMGDLLVFMHSNNLAHVVALYHKVEQNFLLCESKIGRCPVERVSGPVCVR